MRRFLSILCVVIAWGAILSGAEYAIRDKGEFIASEGDTTLWVTYLADRPVIGPIAAAGSLFLAQDNLLLRIDPSSGTILEHSFFPEEIKSLEPEGDAISLLCASRTYSDQAPRYTEALTYRPEDPQGPIFSSGSNPGVRILEMMAENALTRTLEHRSLAVTTDLESFYIQDDSGREQAGPARIGGVNDAGRRDFVTLIPVVEELHARHPSNPWCAFRLAQILFLKGEPDPAATWFAKTLTGTTQSVTALQMSVQAYGFGNRDWSSQLFDRSCVLRHREGYVPQMLTALITLGLGTIHGDNTRFAVQTGDSGEIAALVERLYLTAPRTEAVAYVFQAMADKALEIGDAAGAALWQQRVVEAQPYLVFGLKLGDWQVFAITFLAGSLAALLLLFIVQAGKHKRRVRELEAAGEVVTRMNKSNLLATCTRMEWIGYAVLVTAIILALSATATMVAAIAKTAAVDLAAISGNPGHGSARWWYEQQEDCAAKFVFLGLHYYVRSDYKKAEEYFRKTPESMAALNNLGAVLARQNRKDEAREAWAQVTDGEYTDEAHYNLTGEVTDTWGAYAQKYFPEAPLLVPPSAAEWNELVGADRVFGRLGSVFSLFRGSDGMSGGDVVLMVVMIAFIAMLAMGVKALISPLRPAYADTRGWQWWAGIVVPGSGRIWSGAGILVASAWMCSLMLYRLNVDLPGSLSFIDTNAMPNYSIVFGIGADLEHSRLRAIVKALWHWLPFLIFSFNLAVMLAWRAADKKGEDRDSAGRFIPLLQVYMVVAGFMLLLQFGMALWPSVLTLDRSLVVIFWIAVAAYAVSVFIRFRQMRAE